MSNYAAPVEVVNAALSGMGIRPIQGLDETSKPAIVASDIYEGVVADLLTKHTWSFATKRADLVYQGSTTGYYSSVFAVPSDAINVVTVTMNGVLADYAVQENKILANVGDGLEIKYHYRAPEGDWPGDFAECVVRYLRAHFYRALREDEANADRVEANAEARLTRAMVRDKRQSPPSKEQRINGGRLVTAWRGGA